MSRSHHPVEKAMAPVPDRDARQSYPMEWTPPYTGRQRALGEENARGVGSGHERGGSMGKVISVIGIDISKRYFQLHGASADGEPVLRKKLTRSKLLGFLAKQPVCRVVIEVCASAHHWGRMIQELGHEVRLIPPVYVKPYVKRQKNDANDAGAIVEAAQRPTMRFVAVKTEAEQARSVVFRARELLVHQRTQTINALRGHLAEFGLVAPLGVHNVGKLEEVFHECEQFFPALAPPVIRLLIERIHELDAEIEKLNREIRRIVRNDEALKRLMTIPGVGELTAMAVHAFAPPMESFRTGRDFAAWVGLTPRESSTGGRQRLGRITKMGQRDIRRLLYLGAMSVISSALRRGEVTDPWLARMLDEKPRKVAAVALANRMARIIWAVTVKGESYRARGVTKAVAAAA